MFFNCYRDFEDGTTISALGYDIVLRRRSIGSLQLTSGHLIACDPLSSLETEPFSQAFTPGSYPVSLLVAELRDEERAAYAAIRLGNGEAIRWEVACVQGDGGVLESFEELGYQVESSTGCFMDADTALTLIDYNQIVMPEDNEFDRLVRSQLRKRRKRGPGAATIELGRDLKLPYDDGRNLVVFDAGYGRGVYTTYIGHNENDQIVSVVTDFQVLDFRFPSFSFRGK
ncbi:MAG: DUF4241 domain-containing protein [Bradymonadaceae bacterium]|nr:DUF4241 domain-containing protein [Lujinxingiaceae bacterium]